MAGVSLAGGGVRAVRGLRGNGRQVIILSAGIQEGEGGGVQMTGFPMPAMVFEAAGGLDVADHLMQDALQHAMRVVEQSMEEAMQEAVVPAANENVRDALPRVVVTKEDSLDETNSKCAVCLDDYIIGMRATRMFCGHLFCTTCIREWLRTANSCPVCRFELATDIQEFEVGRRERMRDRISHVKQGELQSMRAPEIKRLMVALGVSTRGCVEKTDLIQRLDEWPSVEVVPDRKDVLYADNELRSLELPLLRTLMERHRVQRVFDDMSEVEERGEALRRFAAAGWVDPLTMQVDPSLPTEQDRPPEAEVATQPPIARTTPRTAADVRVRSGSKNAPQQFDEVVDAEVSEEHVTSPLSTSAISQHVASPSGRQTAPVEEASSSANAALSSTVARPSASSTASSSAARAPGRRRTTSKS